MRSRKATIGLLAVVVGSTGLMTVPAASVAAPSAKTATVKTAKCGVETVDPGEKCVTISSYAQYESFTPGDTDLVCPPPVPADEFTLVEASGRNTIGDPTSEVVKPKPVTFKGYDTWKGCIYLRSDGSAEIYGEAHFVGEIKGCGSGTAKIWFHNSIGAPAADGNQQASGEDWFNEPSTGGLAGVRGMYNTTTIIRPPDAEHAYPWFKDGYGVGKATCRIR